MRITDVVNIPADPNAPLVLRVKAVPRARTTEYIGDMDDGTCKIRVAAVPEDGRANLELRRYLAREFGVPLENVEISSGESATKKLLRIRRSPK